MRFRVFQSVQAAAAASSKQARPTFTCPAPPIASRYTIRRTFATSQRHSNNDIDNKRNHHERPIPSSPPQTHYDFFPQTFPAGPPPNAAFSPDLRQLRKEFLQLQAKAHPDLASSGNKSHAEALSARINEAYKTLQDPLRRAQYLLAQQGIDVEDESAKLDAAGGGDAELLMEVMEAREAVDEVEEESELLAIREENNARIDASVKVLEAAFQTGDLAGAAKEAVKLRYWMNIEESIHGWEKGQGGGIIHH